MNKIKAQAKAQQAFYADLEIELYQILPSEKIHKDYRCEALDNTNGDYLIDYKIDAENGKQVFVFAVADKEKAELVHAILKRLITQRINKRLEYQSLIVFNNFNALPEALVKKITKLSELMLNTSGGLENNRLLQRKIRNMVGWIW